MDPLDTEPQIVAFGPYRVIGLRYEGKNQNGEIPALWAGDTGFIARMGEIVAPPEAKWQDSGRHPAFGLCRCLPGVTDGSFEYLAATPATAEAPIPSGMVEASIPAATYAAFPVNGLANLMPTWEKVPAWLASHSEWEGYCSPDGCDCASHPAFELYPPDFGSDGKMFVYVPLRPKG